MCGYNYDSYFEYARRALHVSDKNLGHTVGSGAFEPALELAAFTYELTALFSGSLAVAVAAAVASLNT